MSDPQKTRPSFSTANRWRIGADVVLRTLLVVAVAGMLNYLGARFYHRFHLSERTRQSLSSRTLNVLESLTNHVQLTLYYDRQANFYPEVLALANEYRAASKKISVQTVDYNRDPGHAQLIKTKYGLSAQSDKDLVIFDGGADHVRTFPGDQLTLTKDVQVAPTDPKQQLEFERRPIAFRGEQAFTSILLSMNEPRLKAYFLQGHGEVSLSDSGQRGFEKFTAIVEQNGIALTNLDGIPSTGVPMDCSLLIIAAPSHPLDAAELAQIASYLQQGGRLLALFSYYPEAPTTGLEKVLQTWGVGVMDDVVQDFNYATTRDGPDIVIYQFGKHPVVDSAAKLHMHVYQPHPVIPLPAAQSANAPEVTPLFGSSPGSTLLMNRNEPARSYSLACAVEQKPVAGVTNPRGTTRMIVAGDATFLGNVLIDSGGNRDFLNASLNWLCNRPLLLVGGIGPRPITNLRLEITVPEKRELNWLLLGALPGSVLALGWVVWLVRRK
jgi:ABC-type uncharacterized transport system involved in gliding motility auxiliary subunit